MPWARGGACCSRGSRAIRGLWNGVDGGLAPLSPAVTSGSAAPGDRAARSTCLPPLDRGALLIRPTRPTFSAAGRGLRAHPLPVVGGPQILQSNPSSS